jgi:hypothetical protein
MSGTKRLPAACLAAAIVGALLAAALAAHAGALFTLHVGETRVVEGLTVGFNGVLADSRCPRDVVCIWEGNAEAQIAAAAPGHDPATLVLNTSPMFATGDKIQLLLLEPYPFSQYPPAPEDYVVTLIVSRVGPTPVEATTWGRIKALFGDQD